MARGLNKVMLIGHLGNDPDIRTTAAGSCVANLSLATSYSFKDSQTGEWREGTEWHRVVFFDRTAEVARDYLRKGSQIFVEGRLRTRKWQDQSGVDRYTTEIVGDNMQMLGGRSDNNMDGNYPQSPMQNTGYAPPAQNAGYASPAQNTGYAPPAQNTGYAPPAQNTGYAPPAQNTGYAPPAQNVEDYDSPTQDTAQSSYAPIDKNSNVPPMPSPSPARDNPSNNNVPNNLDDDIPF